MRVRQYQARLTKRAKELRSNQSEAERLLWYRVRNRQLRNLKFQRQFMLGQYIVDFVCHEYKLIVELDGGQHNENLSENYDERRTQYLNKLGYKVIRFWNNEVLTNITGVLEKILEVVHSHPNLLSEREESSK